MFFWAGIARGTILYFPTKTHKVQNTLQTIKKLAKLKECGSYSIAIGRDFGLRIVAENADSGEGGTKRHTFISNQMMIEKMEFKSNYYIPIKK